MRWKPDGNVHLKHALGCAPLKHALGCAPLKRSVEVEGNKQERK